MHPKFHWLVHLAREHVVSALVREAKHKVPKRYAKDQCNLTGFDESVLSNVTGKHLWQIGDGKCFNFEARLENPREAPMKLRDLVLAELGLRADAHVATSVVARLLACPERRRPPPPPRLPQIGGQAAVLDIS